MRYVLIVIVVMCVAFAQDSGKPAQTIPVCIKLEREDRGTNRGMWIQEATDLTPQELRSIQSLVTAKIQRNGIRIVPITYPDNFVSIAVVVAKVRGKAESVYIASSAI